MKKLAIIILALAMPLSAMAGYYNQPAPEFPVYSDMHLGASTSLDANDNVQDTAIPAIKVLSPKDVLGTNGNPNYFKLLAVGKALVGHHYPLVVLNNTFGNVLKPLTVMPKTLKVLAMYQAYVEDAPRIGVSNGLPIDSMGYHINNVNAFGRLNNAYLPVLGLVQNMHPVLVNYDGHDFNRWKQEAAYALHESKRLLSARFFGKKHDIRIIPYVSPFVIVKQNKTNTVVDTLSYSEMRTRVDYLKANGASGVIVTAPSNYILANGLQPTFDQSEGWGAAIVEYVTGVKY